MEIEFNSNIYFKSLPYDEWIRFDSIPKYVFKNVWDYIDQPKLRPNTDIFISSDFTQFKKTYRYGKRPF